MGVYQNAATSREDGQGLADKLLNFFSNGRVLKESQLHFTRSMRPNGQR
jgi:hypothetical protein